MGLEFGRRLPSSVTTEASILVSVPLVESTEGNCRWKRPCSWHLQRPGDSRVWVRSGHQEGLVLMAEPS